MEEVDEVMQYMWGVKLMRNDGLKMGFTRKWGNFDSTKNPVKNKIF